MNIFFEFMSMILKNHMYKINLSRFLKMQSLLLFKNSGCSKKRGRLQVDEILDFFTFFS